MKLANLGLISLLPLLSIGCSVEGQSGGAGHAEVFGSGGPSVQAAHFQARIEAATVAEDFDHAIALIRKMDEYMTSLSDDERREFVAHWSEPPLELWLHQTTAKLEADAIRRRQRESDSKN